jgi:endonuclease YncB( thermonuclease family)
MTVRSFTLSRLLFAAACLCASTAFADNLSGQASIIDGDTFEIHGTRTRLWGIDAPESNQLCRGDDSTQYRCGQKAANDLDAMIARRPVTCVAVANWLIRNGHALDGPRYRSVR